MHFEETTHCDGILLSVFVEEAQRVPHQICGPRVEYNQERLATYA